MRFDDFGLTAKSLIPLGLTCALFLGTTALGVYRMNDLGERYEYLAEHSNAAAANLLRSNRAATEIGFAIHEMIAYDAGTPLFESAREEFEAAGPRIEQLLNEAARLDPARAPAIDGFREKIAHIVEHARPALQIAKEFPGLENGSRLKPHDLDQLARCVTLLRGVDAEIHALTSEMKSFYIGALAENKAVGEKLRAQTDQVIWTMLLIGALAILGGCAVSVFVSSRKIGRPIARLTEQMRAIADGDLAVAVEGVTRRDEVGAMAKALDTFKRHALESRAAETRAAEERRRGEVADARRAAEQAATDKDREAALEAIGEGLESLSAKNLAFRLTKEMPAAYRRLQSDFNSAMGQLESALGVVADGAEAIGSGANQIAVAADDLSRRTEQQAASLEQTAAALEEITTTVKHSADGAARASNVVGDTKLEAEKSGEIVRRAVDAMGRIEKSSEQIGQIIGVIDEIAFQTNLLALNAGVEAARAGDAGKGFAVVASEVRALAQRSAEAAKEIKSLVSASSIEVEQGVELVGATGEALTRIVGQVAEIDKVVADIAAGAREQATGLAEINTAVGQMDQNTQKNAAMVEQTTAASANLRRETDQLTQSVASFRLGRAPARAARPALKTLSSGGGNAVRKTREAPADEDWTEF